MVLVKIIIPIYTLELSSSDMLSLKQTFKLMSNYPIVIAHPLGLDISSLQSMTPEISFEEEIFDPIYFKGIDGYNKLMLSSLFYERFLDVDYILICQTDVYIFEDALDFWCRKGYDYIGAPWIGSKQNRWNKILKGFDNILRIIKGKKSRNWDHLFMVGNGGFSLRKVRPFYEISSRNKDLIEHYRCNKDSIYHVEDIFWSLKAKDLYSDFKIPNYIEALGFAMDRKPNVALKLNNNKLPFACHGINKPKVEDFWGKIIKNSYSTE